MLGREAYQNPWLLARVDEVLFGAPNPATSRDEIIAALLPYAERQLAAGGRLNHITRPYPRPVPGRPGSAQVQAPPQRERLPGRRGPGGPAGGPGAGRRVAHLHRAAARKKTRHVLYWAADLATLGANNTPGGSPHDPGSEITVREPGAGLRGVPAPRPSPGGGGPADRNRAGGFHPGRGRAAED